MLSGSKVGSGAGRIIGKRNKQHTRRRRVASAALLAVGSGMLARQASAANNDLWAGNTSVFFNNGANWTSGSVPATLDSLEFGLNGSSGLTLTDNLFTPAAFNLSGITFDSTAPAYVIAPGISATNGFTLNGTITNNSTSLETINDLVTLSGSSDSLVATGNITFGGVISGAANLSTSGGGTIVLNGTNTFTGNMTIGSGTVIANVGNASLVNAFSTGGTSIGQPDASRTITINSGGTLNFNAANGMGFNSNTNISTGIIVNSGGTLTSSVSYTTLGGVTLNGGTLTNTVAAGTDAWYMRGNLNTCILTVGGTSPSLISGTGYFCVSSTPMTFNVGVTGSSQPDLTVSDWLVNSPSGAASGIRKAGLGTMLLSGTTAYTGSTQVSNGTLQVSGTMSSSTSLVLGLNTSTPAIFAVLPGASVAFNGIGYIGENATAAGAVYQTGGTLTGISTLSLGAVTGGSYGYYNLSGGSATMTEVDAGGLVAGPSVGVVDVTGGTLKTTGYFCLSRDTAGGTGIVNVLGGNVNASGSGFLMNFGGASTSVLSVGGTGNVNAPTLTLNMMDAGASGALGSLNLLSGGTAQFNGITSTAVSGANTFVNFNGGTLKAGGANTSFLTSSAVTGVDVYSGGGTINNNGSNITIAAALVAPTGSGVTFGTITPSAGGSGYVAAPAVTFTSGGGVGATGYAVVSGGVVTGVVVTNPGINYTSAPTVVFTGGGGSGAAATSAITANVGGGLNFSGGGITTLSGTSTYTGATNILSGSTLNVTGKLGNTAVTVNSGGFLTGSGILAGNVTINNGGLIDFTKDGLSNTTTLTAGGLTLGAASSPAAITFNFASASADSINLGSGVLNDLGGAAINLNALNISSGTQTYTLISYGSQTGLTPASGGGFTIGTHPAGLYTFTLLDTATALKLTVSSTAPPLTAYWTGKDDTVWGDYNTTGPVTNFSSTSDGNTDAGQLPSTATDVVFTAASNGNSTSLSGAAISTTLGTNFSINSLTVNSTAGSVAINGSNTLTLNAAASTGSLGYSAGTGLVVQSGAGPVNIGVTTLFPATSQTWSNNGSNPLTISSAVTGTATTGHTTTLTFGGSGSGSTTLSGVIGNGSAGGSLGLSVAQSGSGPVILSGNNTFTGGVTISSGTLTLGNAGALNSAAPNALNLSGGTLDLNTNSVVVTSILAGTASAPGGVITDNNASSGVTTLIDTNTGSQTFYGKITDGSSRTLAFNYSGGGTVVMATSNAYSGGTQLTSGTLQALNGSSLGTGTINMSGGAVSLKIANGVTLPNKVIVNAANPGTGLGALTTVTSTDTATFSGEIDYNTAVASGGLIVGPSSGLLSFTGPIIEPSVSAPAFIQIRNGIVQLADATGNSSYPELLVTPTTVSLGHNNGMATNAALVINGGTMDLNGYNQTVSAIALQTGVTTGIITNSNGLAAGNDVGPDTGPNQSSVLTVNTSSTAYPDSAPDVYAGNLNGYIQLVKTGAGTLAMNGSTNTYLGGTVIQQGVLAVASLDNGGSLTSANTLGESYLGAADLTFAAPGGTLRYAGTGATASTGRSFTINDGVTATIDVSNASTVLTVTGNAAVDGTESTSPANFAKGPGAGTLVLTGTYPYHGNTTVNGGKLVVNGTTGTPGYGNISVASGATLGGTGTLSGAFNHTAGTIVGGASLTLPTTGSLTFTDPVTLNGGTDLNNINSSALSTSGVNQQGYINAAGGLTFGSTPETVSLQFVGTLPVGTYVYNLFDCSGTPGRDTESCLYQQPGPRHLRHGSHHHRPGERGHRQRGGQLVLELHLQQRLGFGVGFKRVIGNGELVQHRHQCGRQILPGR
jgi:autotransporter-associated beta strand protein